MMSIISEERTFTLEKIKSITSLDIAKFFFLLAIVLPFFIYKRAPPQLALFSELTGVIFISLFILFASLGSRKFELFNRTMLYLTIVASYLIFDIYINSPIYPSLHWLYIGSLMLGALLASVTSNLTHKCGHRKIFITICYCLMAGAIIQDIIVILQMLHQEWLNGWIFVVTSGLPYSGNVGQRNLLAHYLSWGLLATAYLLYNKNLSRIFGWTLIVSQAAILGVGNSRALVIYMLAILATLVITMIWQKQLSKSVFKTLATTTILVLVFQVITLPILSVLQGTPDVSANSIDRLSDNLGILSRLSEWHKAWLILLDNPWFGTGWNSYGYQGFVTSLEPMFANTPYENALFSHSHSIIFNMLAETGILGTVIILGGFLYCLKPLFIKKWSAETVFLSAMIIVTIIHSLVEYPLWYAHFFLVFVILLTLLNSSIKSDQIEQPSSHYAFIPKYLVGIIALSYFIAAVHMYYSYWQLEQLTYAYDKNEQDRINTAANMLEIGHKQPLISAYADIRSLHYLTGISPDKIPDKFSKPLSDFAHYLPEKMSGIYYLTTQCDNNGEWSIDNWRYYNQLNHYYKKSVPTYSIVLSMTSNCDKVYETVYKACESYFEAKGQNPTCSVEASKTRFE